MHYPKQDKHEFNQDTFLIMLLSNSLFTDMSLHKIHLLAKNWFLSIKVKTTYSNTRIFWNLISQNLRVQKLMSQRSAGSCTRCTHSNAFPVIWYHKRPENDLRERKKLRIKNSTFHIVDLYKRKCKACIFLKEPFYWIARLGVYKTVEYGYIAGS